MRESSSVCVVHSLYYGQAGALKIASGHWRNCFLQLQNSTRDFFAATHASVLRPGSASSFPSLPTCYCGGKKPALRAWKTGIINASVYKVICAGCKIEPHMSQFGEKNDNWDYQKKGCYQ